METIGVKELRDNLSRILRRVEEGKIIRVFRHGKDIVELRPVRSDPEQNLLDRLRNKQLLGGGTGRIRRIAKTVKNLDPDKPVSDFVREDRQ